MHFAALLQELQDLNAAELQKAIFDCSLPHDLSLRCYQALLVAVSNCHQHLFEVNCLILLAQSKTLLVA